MVLLHQSFLGATGTIILPKGQRYGSNSAQIINTIHDELVIEVAENDAEETAEIVKKIMIKAGNELITKVPIDVDIKIANTWGG